ncbi:MAG: lipid II flippase MurJ, partial [Myxococcota bacterium]
MTVERGAIQSDGCGEVPNTTMAVNTPNAGHAGETAPGKPQSVARSAGTVGLFTMVSRFGGLFRDAVFANLFGAGTASDAYLMAFTIPNTFRTLVAEGS